MNLNNLKIIELATVLAGPVVGSFFSELGAKVIKFENKNSGGDVTRTWRTKGEKSDTPVSAYYASANYGKEVRMVNLTEESDRQLVYDEIKDADVVISNFKPHSAEKLGMHSQKIAEINSLIIYGCINGYGDDDPRPAFDAILQAECGLMSMNGTPESGPLKWPLAMVDLLAAHQLKQAILVALINRQKNNEGQYISVSLYDAAISTLSNQGSDYLMNGHIPERIGSRHPGIAPYGDTFKTNDQEYIVLAVGNNRQFKQLLKLLKLTELLDDDRFSTNQKRVKNREAMFELLQGGFQMFSSSEVLTQMKKNEVPGSLVKNIKQVFEETKAKSNVLEETIDGMSTKRVKTAIFKSAPISPL